MTVGQLAGSGRVHRGAHGRGSPLRGATPSIRHRQRRTMLHASTTKSRGSRDDPRAPQNVSPTGSASIRGVGDTSSHPATSPAREAPRARVRVAACARRLRAVIFDTGRRHRRRHSVLTGGARCPRMKFLRKARSGPASSSATAYARSRAAVLRTASSLGEGRRHRRRRRPGSRRRRTSSTLGSITTTSPPPRLHAAPRRGKLDSRTRSTARRGSATGRRSAVLRIAFRTAARGRTKTRG